MASIDRGLVNNFNRGEVSVRAMAREEVEKVEDSCELMLNMLPERLGPMRYRPGAGLLDATLDAQTLAIPYVFDGDSPDVLLLEYASGSPGLKIWSQGSDAFVSASNTGSLTWGNGDFTTVGFGAWIDNSSGTAFAGISGNDCTLLGTSIDAASVYQTSTGASSGDVYTAFIHIDRGECQVMIGDGGVGSGNLFDGYLGVGYHYITVTVPSTNQLTMTLYNNEKASCDINVADLDFFTDGADFDIPLKTALSMVAATLTGPASFAEFREMDYDIDGADMFFTGGGFPPFFIRKWGAQSFSVQRFRTVNGPYEAINTTDITMSIASGSNTITASRSFFHNDTNADWQGVPIKVAVAGQTQTASGSTNSVQTAGVFVFGTGDARKFQVSISVSAGAYNDIWLEKSFDEVTWQKVKGYTSGAAVSETYNDGLDGADIYYRLQVEDIGTASSVTLTITYDYGTLEFHGTITTRSSDVLVGVKWDTGYPADSYTTTDWYIGSIGGDRPWPSAVAVHQGRLWFAVGNNYYGSESANLAGFDRNVEGDSASILARSGGVQGDTFWLAPSARVVGGSTLAEVGIGSDSLGAVLTPTNTQAKPGSNRGCSKTLPLVSDQEVLFVQRGGERMLGIEFELAREKHLISDLTLLNPDALPGGAIELSRAVVPEPRIFALLNDGTIRPLLRDVAENVSAWSRITVKQPGGTDATVISMAVLPGPTEDRIYITTSGGDLLRFAMESEVGATLSASKHFDYFETFTSPGTTITLSTAYSSGNSVGVWVDGVDDGDYTVNGSRQITGVTSGTNVVVGTRYNGDYKSNKLTGHSGISTINRRKRILNTGLVMSDWYPGGVKAGPDENNLKPLRALEDNTTRVAGPYDYFPVPSVKPRSKTDPRIYIRATAPCTILALSYDAQDVSEKSRAKQ